MMPHVFHTLGTDAIVGAAAGSAAGTLLPAALLLCIVVVVVGGLRFRALWAEYGTQTRELQKQNDAVRAGLEQLQKIRTDLDAKQRELLTLRQETGSQRKKNHALQDDIKRMRTTLKDETERRIAAQNTRPAFAEPAAPKVVEQRPGSEAAKPPRESEIPRAPAFSPAAAVVVPPAPSQLALQAQIKTLEAELTQQKQIIGDERTLMTGLKDELKKMRKRSEDLRRIDIITKSKMEVLEDKLRHLGRAHYEAISEVALLKGEVQPPRPREPVRPASVFEGTGPAEAETDNGLQADSEVEAANAHEEDFDAAPPHDAPGVAQQVSLQ